jgi:hypothetical protein
MLGVVLRTAPNHLRNTAVLRLLSQASNYSAFRFP